MQLSCLLKQIMEEKGIGNTNIVKNCEQKGIKIDSSYISKILKDKIDNPSNSKLEAIAIGCDVDPNMLILEHYLNNAPQVLNDFLYNLKISSAIAGTKIYNDLLCDITLEQFKEVIEKMPISKFILEDNNFDINYLSRENNSVKIEDTGENFSVQLVDSISYQVTDNAMEPIIPINSKITLYPPKSNYDDYRNGDILAVEIKRDEELLVRQAYFSKNSITLTVINNVNYDAKKYKKEYVVILGKVHKIITEL